MLYGFRKYRNDVRTKAIEMDGGFLLKIGQGTIVYYLKGENNSKAQIIMKRCGRESVELAKVIGDDDFVATIILLRDDFHSEHRSKLYGVCEV